MSTVAVYFWPISWLLLIDCELSAIQFCIWKSNMPIVMANFDHTAFLEECLDAESNLRVLLNLLHNYLILSVFPTFDSGWGWTLSTPRVCETFWGLRVTSSWPQWPLGSVVAQHLWTLRSSWYWAAAPQSSVLATLTDWTLTEPSGTLPQGGLEGP